MLGWTHGIVRFIRSFSWAEIIILVVVGLISAACVVDAVLHR